MRDIPDTRIERIAAELRQPVQLDETFDARVMAVVRAMPRHRFGRLARVLRPRKITINPILSGLAAALLFAVALAAGHAIGTARESHTAEASSEGAARPGGAQQGAGGATNDVQFVLVAPDARKVAVVGDFNDWDSSHAAYQAQHRGGGVWSVTAAVPAGHHRYSFVVDDSVWVADPTAPRVLDDDYGLPNSALVVLGGDTAP
jgi:hypothetical protein